MLTGLSISIGLFVCLIAVMVFGRSLGRRVYGDTDPPSGSGAADSVVFAVLGLLIAFTFTTSAAKFDQRRKLIVDQANALGTAWLRVDVLPSADQRAIRERMARWAELAADGNRWSDPLLARSGIAEGSKLQAEAWSLAVASIQAAAQPQLYAFVLAPINDWMDLSSTRLEMNDMGLPPMVVPTLILFAMLSAVLAGFNMRRIPQRIPLHMLTFAATVAFAIYVIVDLNSPRAGLIRLANMDADMQQLSQSFHQQLEATTRP